MVSDEEIVKALESRNRIKDPFWTAHEFAEEFGVSQGTVSRWLNGDGKKKVGLVAEGKIKKKVSGSTSFYMMPGDTVVRDASFRSVSVGRALLKYTEFGEFLKKWRNVAFGVTVLYFLIRLTAKEPLIDEFTVWGLILICTMMLMEAHINQTLRTYTKPPNSMPRIKSLYLFRIDLSPRWIESLKAALSIESVSGAVGTGVMVYLIFGYFDYVTLTSVIAGVGVVGLEVLILIFAGLNAKTMIRIADTML